MPFCVLTICVYSCLLGERWVERPAIYSILGLFLHWSLINSCFIFLVKSVHSLCSFPSILCETPHTLFFFQEVSFCGLFFFFYFDIWLHFSCNFSVNLPLGHLPLKKMTRKIVLGSPKRKSPETLSSQFARNPNRRGCLGGRRTPGRSATARKAGLLRSW